jgi:hypothetical protein
MAVELADLVNSLEAALNVPGAARPMFDFSDEDPWINALAAAFWTAKNRGRAVSLWKSYRVNLGEDEIVNIDDPAGAEIPREDQAIVVGQAALTAIETLLLSLPTHTKSVAGPVSTETDRSSTILRQLLVDKRAELEEILKGAAGGNATRAYVIDAILQRSGGFSTGLGVFVN